MNKRVFLAFLKDQIPYTLAFYSSAAFIALFYWLETNQQISIIYPFLLVSFFYVMFLIFKGIRYTRYFQIVENFDEGISDPLLKNSSFNEIELKAINSMKALEVQSQKKLHKLELENETKHQVISQMIHNVKTPTAVIDLLVQNSKVQVNDAEETIDKISKENSSINENLNQILNYLRLDFFENDFLIEEVEIIEQIRELINGKKEMFIYNQVFPKLVTEVDKLHVITDKKWNRIILDQLVTNAIKYTALKEGEKKVYFQVVQKNDRVQLIIEDTGIGITATDLKRVFEPFFTGENGRKIRNATGIGLHISKTIADQLHHKMSIKSSVNEGTKVTITYLTKV